MSIGFADERPAEPAVLRDAKEYSDILDKIAKLKIDDQVDAWQTFLSDHPNQSFRKEIEKNIERLESLSTKKNDKKHGDEKDAELYLKAIEYVKNKRLNSEDQILMWQQFLDDHPTNIYRNEVQTKIYKLKRTLPRMQAVPKTQSQLSPQSATPSSIPPKPPLAIEKKTSNNVGGIKPIKDPDRATLLAWLPGLVVPGMGHWYTNDFAIAGILTAIRVGGTIIGVIGIINRENEKIFIGAGMDVVSYAIDIADAPFSANRYNESHTSAYLLPEERSGKTYPLFAHTFTF